MRKQVMRIIVVNLVLSLILVISMPFSSIFLLGFWGLEPIIHEQLIVIILNIIYIILWVVINRCISRDISIFKLLHKLLYINYRLKLITSIFIVAFTIWFGLHSIPLYTQEKLENYTSEEWNEFTDIQKYAVSLSLYIYAKPYRAVNGYSGRKQFAHDYIQFLDSSEGKFTNLYYYVMSSISGYGA